MFKITGLDKLEKELKGLQEKVDNLSSEPATFDELFSKSFMEKYTNSKSFDEFLILGGFEVTSQEDFEILMNQHLMLMFLRMHNLILGNQCLIRQLKNIFLKN